MIQNGVFRMNLRADKKHLQHIITEPQILVLIFYILSTYKDILVNNPGYGTKTKSVVIYDMLDTIVRLTVACN